MKIQTRERIIGGSNKSTFIATNLRKEREMLDRNGNVIDPRSKQIIRKAEDNK